MATLLIGSNGLIGVNLVNYLCDMGEELICFSSRPPANPVKGCTYVQGDITEYGTINMVLKNYKVDRIIHNAAVSHPKLYVDNPYKIYRTNVTGTLTALEAARNYGVERFIYMSSSAVYGNVSMDVLTEDVTLFAENPYGATKIACEHLVRCYGLDSTSLRIGHVYGPARKFECPINMLLMDCIKKGEVNWDHGIEQRLDYIFVQDVVKAVVKAAFASHLPHAEYNVGGGGEVTPFSRIVDKVQTLYPTVPINIGPGDLGYDNLGALCVDRATADFGWKPEVSIEEGIEIYNKWLIENA